MSKFLSWNFAGVLLFSLILFAVHEWGHYLAYRLLGHQAMIRKSALIPGIDPKETIIVSRWQGVLIALAGFILSTIAVVLPLWAFNYQYWYLMMIGSLGGSIVDFIWAFSMLWKKSVTIEAGNR